MAGYASVFHGGLGDDAVGWPTDHGWDVETHDRLEVAAAYGRAVPADTSGGFITATRSSADAQGSSAARRMARGRRTR